MSKNVKVLPCKILENWPMLPMVGLMFYGDNGHPHGSKCLGPCSHFLVLFYFSSLISNIGSRDMIFLQFFRVIWAHRQDYVMLPPIKSFETSGFKERRQAMSSGIFIKMFNLQTKKMPPTSLLIQTKGKTTLCRGEVEFVSSLLHCPQSAVAISIFCFHGKSCL